MPLLKSAQILEPVTDDILPRIYKSSILIVDDNSFNCIFLEKVLYQRGFTNLLSVGSGNQALEVLPEFQPEMVILDIMMPDMDGFECCGRIRSHPKYHDLPILIQTALVEPHLRVKAFHMGATDLVSKPIYPEELCARVMVHLEKRQSMVTLQQYKERIEVELESARQLQLTILPDSEDLEDARLRGQLDIAAYFQPSSELGGDFWGMKTLSACQTALWLVDFSGHGVTAALNAFRLQAYLKERSTLIANPGEYMTRLNEKLLHLLMRGQFATMFFGIVDTKTNQLLYSCACSPHPIIMRKESGRAEMIDGSGIPLGTGRHSYASHTVPFHPGDMLLLYSDALTETPDAKGSYITEQDIMLLVERCADDSADEIREQLLTYFKRHALKPLSDDLTIAISCRPID